MKTKFLFIIITSFFLLNGCSTKDVVQSDPVIIKPDPSKDPVSYNPANGNKIEKDTKIKPTSATASEHQSGTDIQKTIDGDKASMYHSRWGDQTTYPVDLIYNFSQDQGQVDYFVLYPRTDGENGVILELTVYVQAHGKTEFKKVEDFIYENGGTPKIITLSKDFNQPAAIKLSVTKGINDFVSLAEIEFYRNNSSLEASLSVFSDKACTELKPGTTKEDIMAIDNEFVQTMALAIYNKVYDKFRIGTFKSYPNPSITAHSNKTSTYGIYDNVTGIHVSYGTEMVVFVNDFVGEISLRVVYHNRGFEGVDYVLKPGVNRFKVDTEGLAYLIYQDANPHEVKVNFATGKINGYFDVAKHTKEDWRGLIENATYSHFDVLGKLAHLSFTTDDLRQHTPDITELIALYDDIVYLEEDFLGLYKYNRANKSRMYFRTNTHENMHMYATSYRTEYNKNTMAELCNPSRLKSSPWGPAHEVGHINQTRPGLRWLGLTEVTTNIYSLYVQTTWGNNSRLDEENVAPYNNRYEKAFTEMLAAGIGHGQHEDVFCKLVPFWQLQLYFSNVLGNKDFYKDVHETIRVNANPTSHGVAQVEFAKICSDIAQMDLTEFFIDWGFLKPITTNIDDYGQGSITVTQAMVDDAIASIQSKGYSKPEMKLQYIHDKNVTLFQAKAALSVGNASVVGNHIQISGTQNAVVYQQERNGKVIHVSTRDGFNVNSFNPTDKIFAVGYDGHRKEISVK